MKEFFTAAKDTLGEVDPDDLIQFKHDGREVTFYKPSTGQLSIMLAMTTSDMGTREAGLFIQMFFEMADDETQRYFQTRLLDRADPFDLDSEGGIFDIWEELAGEWSGKATKQPSDYQPPRRATGTRSTASTRAKGSTSSRSRSRATSQ